MDEGEKQKLIEDTFTNAIEVLNARSLYKRSMESILP